jgi:Mg-chelatase subunit ChlD
MTRRLHMIFLLSVLVGLTALGQIVPQAKWVAPSNDKAVGTKQTASPLVSRTLQLPLQPKTAALPGISLSLDSHNIGLFPYVFVNFSALVDSLPIGTLTAADFTVTENDVLQPIVTFQQPVATGGTKAADIIFVFDDTGSMSGQIEGCKNNVIAFADSLATYNVDYRLGLITFKDNYTTINDGNLTADKTTFQGWISALYANGGDDGPENSFDAIDAASKYNFRPGVQKIFIVITDANAHYLNDGTSFSTHTLESIVSLVKSKSITVNVAGPQIAEWYGTGSLTEATGGRWFNTADPLTLILGDISTRLANQYVLSYRSSTPVMDGVLRHVHVIGVSGATKDTIEITYTPGVVPQIVRTPATAALSSTPEPAGGTSVTIAAWVIDHYPPYANNVKLYYKPVADSLTSGFSSVAMANTRDSLWEAVIPSEALVAPGVKYYITAADSVSSTSDPLLEPMVNPYMISVLPNRSPILIHTPIHTLTRPVSDVVINVTASDSTSYVSVVRLGYRRTGTLTYTVVDLPLISGTNSNGAYRGTIASAVAGTSGLQYYVCAVDNYGVYSYIGTSSDPIEAVIPDPGTTVSGQTILSGAAAINSIYAPVGTVLRVYAKRTGNLVDSTTVLPFMSGKNYAVSILSGDGGVHDGDTLQFLAVDATGAVIHPRYNPTPVIVTFDSAFPPAVKDVDIQFARTRMMGWQLVQGYNAVSWNVKPAADSAKSVFGDLLGGGKVQIILAYQNDGTKTPQFTYYIPELAQYNPLQMTDLRSGYFVRLKKGSSPDSLRITGIPAMSNIPIPVRNGYNFVSYLPEGTDSLPTALASLAGSYSSVLDYMNTGTGLPGSEYYNSYPASLSGMHPGKGYFINVTATLDTLVYGAMFSGHSASSIVASVYSSASQASLAQMMVAYGTEVTHKGARVAARSRLQAIGENGEVYGTAAFAADGIVSIVIAGDNPATPAKEGAVIGETIGFRLNDAMVPYKIQWTGFGDTPLLGELANITAVEKSPGVPDNFALHQNYPNPFNPSTTIMYDVPQTTRVTITVYSALGEEVSVLVNNEMPAGRYSIVWNGRIQNRSTASSGIYFVRMTAGQFTAAHKMLLLK